MARTVMIDSVEVPPNVVTAMETVRNFAGLVKKRDGLDEVVISIASSGGKRIEPVARQDSDQMRLATGNEAELSELRKAVLARKAELDVIRDVLTRAVAALNSMPHDVPRKERKALGKVEAEARKHERESAEGFEKAAAAYETAGGTFPIEAPEE